MVSIHLLFQLPAPALTPKPTITDVFTNLQTKLILAVPSLITGAIVLAAFLFVAWLGKRLIAYAAPRAKADTGVVLLLSRVYYYGVLIFGLVTALGAAGLNVSALVAGLGLTGFALGFALKDVLSNLLSGIMLLIYRPFHIGDQIRMGEYEGTITTIRMRDTVVRGYDGRLIIIPNTKLITEVVINNSQSRLVREAVAFNVSAAADLDVARETIARVMDEHPELKDRAEPLVHVQQIDHETARLEGRFWYDPRRSARPSLIGELSQAIIKDLAAASIHATLAAPTKREPVVTPAAEEAEEEVRPKPSSEMIL